MKIIHFASIALTVAALASSAANADTDHRRHRASDGMARHISAPAPTSFQSVQGGGASNDCEGPRVFGFCDLR